MAVEEEAFAPGTVFAGYEVVRLLGEGGFGAVYEAVKPGLAEPVALKVLRAEVADNHEVVRRFFREAQAVAQLRHPNIVGAVDMGEFEGHPFLAMELLRGEALTELMNREGRVPLSRALDIAIPLLAAVRTVHAQGIVHRDLKPDNVFLTYNEVGAVVPKILDFGFAKMAEPGMQITRADTAIGTPNFMSPEQMLAPRDVDPRSDQWALGVLLYYLLTGVKPFAGKTLGDTLKNVLHHDPAPLRSRLPELPQGVEAAVARALRKSPAERFPTVHELAEALVPFDTSPTIAVMRPATASPRPAPVRPSPDAYTLSMPPAAPDVPHSLQPVAAPRAAPATHTTSPAVAIAGAVAFALSAIAAASVWAVRHEAEAPRYASPGAAAQDASADAGDASDAQR